ncbi:MAG: hypothetical protein ACRCU3_02710 [Eubacteriaceae bacterium]
MVEKNNETKETIENFLLSKKVLKSDHPDIYRYIYKESVIWITFLFTMPMLVMRYKAGIIEETSSKELANINRINSQSEGKVMIINRKIIYEKKVPFKGVCNLQDLEKIIDDFGNEAVEVYYNVFKED